MPSRRLPRTVEEHKEAIRIAKAKKEAAAPGADLPITPEIIAVLLSFYPRFVDAINAAKLAQSIQTTATRKKVLSYRKVALIISHYFQTMNNAIARGEIPAEHRNLYGLAINDSRAPVIRSEAELSRWADNLITGDAMRIAQGGIAMSMPSAAQVQAAYTIYLADKADQSAKKEAYDRAQEVLSALMPEARQIVKDIWNDVENTFRNDDDESRRRKAAEYGVVYVSDEAGDEEPEEGVMHGTVEPETSAIIMNGGFDVNDLFAVTNLSDVDMECYTTLKADDPKPSTTVKVPAGLTIEMWASELGAEGNTLFMIYNPDKITAGEYEARITGEMEG